MNTALRSLSAESKAVLTRLALSLGLALALAACGGGGSEANPSPPGPLEPANVRAQLRPEVKLVSLAQAAAITDQAEAQDNTALVIIHDGTSEVLRSAQLGDVIFLPDDAAGREPFIGRVRAVGTGPSNSLELAPVAVEDAFSIYKVSFDTQKHGAQLSSVSMAPGATARRFAQGAFVSTDGVKTTGGLGLRDASLQVELPIREGATGIDVAKIVVKVDIKSINFKFDADFDASRALLGQSEWLNLGLTVSADYAASASLTGTIETNFSDLLRLNRPIWGKLTTKVGSRFRLEGLDEDDKKGRYAVAGLWITPTGAVVNLTGLGTMTQDRVIRSAASTLGVLLWVYLDADGKVTLEGEIGARKGQSADLFGFALTDGGANGLDAKTTNSVGARTFEMPYFDGKAELNGRFGPTIGADVVALGIRPASAYLFAGVKAQAKGQGTAAYDMNSQRWNGNACASLDWRIGAYFSAYARIKSTIKLWRKPVSAVGAEWEWDEAPVLGWENILQGPAKCWTSSIFDFTLSDQGISSLDPSRRAVLVDFGGLLTALAPSRLVDTWDLAISAFSQPTEITQVAASTGGRATVHLLPGLVYTVTLSARNDIFGVVTQGSKTIQVGASGSAPSVASVTFEPDPPVVGVPTRISIAGVNIPDAATVSLTGCAALAVSGVDGVNQDGR